MAKVKEEVFTPIPENVQLYDELYQYYLDVHDYFGKENSSVMHGLKRMKLG